MKNSQLLFLSQESTTFTDERKRPLSSVSNSAIDNSAKKVKSEDAISGLGRGRGVKPNLNTSRARAGSTRPKLRETSDNKRAQESTKEKRLVNFGSFLDSVANSQEETPTSSYDEGRHSYVTYVFELRLENRECYK